MPRELRWKGSGYLITLPPGPVVSLVELTLESPDGSVSIQMSPSEAVTLSQDLKAASIEADPITRHP